MQPYTFIIPEDLPQGTTVGDETVSAVGDLDSIDSPFYFYMLDEEGMLITLHHRCVSLLCSLPQM